MQFGVLKVFINCGILFNLELLPALIHFINNLSRHTVLKYVPKISGLLYQLNSSVLYTLSGRSNIVGIRNIWFTYFSDEHDWQKIETTWLS